MIYFYVDEIGNWFELVRPEYELLLLHIKFVEAAAKRGDPGAEADVITVLAINLDAISRQPGIALQQ
jgi:hypothetical protein